MSLKRQRQTDRPGRCAGGRGRVMYFTANGRALPCCIAPFSQHGYENYTLGDATQQTLREIWNGPAYQDFRDALSVRRTAAVVRQLRPALELVGWQTSRPTSLAPLRRGTGSGNANASRRHPDAWTRRRRSRPCVGVDAARQGSDEVIVVDSGAATARRSVAAAAGARVIVEPSVATAGPCLAAAMAAADCRHRPLHRRRRQRRRAARRRAGRADRARRARLRHRLAPARRARARQHDLAADVAGQLAGLAASGAVRRALHRHVAFRAIRREAPARLGMREATYGWNHRDSPRTPRAARSSMPARASGVAQRVRPGRQRAHRRSSSR